MCKTLSDQYFSYLNNECSDFSLMEEDKNGRMIFTAEYYDRRGTFLITHFPNTIMVPSSSVPDTMIPSVSGHTTKDTWDSVMRLIPHYSTPGNKRHYFTIKFIHGDNSFFLSYSSTMTTEWEVSPLDVRVDSPADALMEAGVFPTNSKIKQLYLRAKYSLRKKLKINSKRD